MILLDVIWSEACNVVVARCDCGVPIAAWASHSLVTYRCGRVEYWHDFDPKGARGTRFFSEDWPVMTHALK